MSYSIDTNVFTHINLANKEWAYSIPGGGHFQYTANPNKIPAKSLSTNYLE